MNNIRYSDVHKSDPKTIDTFLLQTRMELFGIAAAFSKNYFGSA
jgi:hypothetical protein